MLIDSLVIGRGSGSAGGITVSHNRAGQYMKARSLPTNPNTSFQQAVRDFVSQLSALWVSTLTQAERDKWTTYAENVAVINRLGDTMFLTGLNMYVRSNVPILQAGFARQDDAPVIFSLGDFTAPVIVGSEGVQQVAVTFTTTDDWVGEDDAAMMVYVSRPVNASINYFKGPYRLAGTVDGDAITPPTSPALIDVPFAITEGQKLFTRAQVFRADGRLSADTRDGRLVIA